MREITFLLFLFRPFSRPLSVTLRNHCVSGFAQSERVGMWDNTAECVQVENRVAPTDAHPLVTADNLPPPLFTLTPLLFLVRYRYRPRNNVKRKGVGGNTKGDNARENGL